MQVINNNPIRLPNEVIKIVAETASSAELDQNRLEALVVLSNSLVQEIQSLTREKNKYFHVRINLPAEVQNYEISLIRCALMRTGGNQRRAARLLGIKITTLNNKIKRLGISPSGLATED